MSNKKSFILYLDQQDLFNKLPDDIAGKLIKHIFSYVKCEHPKFDDLVLEIAFESIKQSLKRDLALWEKQCKQRSDAGKKSAAARANEKQRKATKSTSVNSRSTKSTDSDSDSDSDNEKTKKKKKKKKLDYSQWPELPSEQTLEDWILMRSRLKANVSQTVINNFAKQLQKATFAGHTVEYCISECVTRNWRGFKAEWLENEKNNRNTQQSDSRAKKVSDRLNEIGARDIEENGIASVLGNRDI